ncbi:MAG: hypothetical protein OXQ29_12105 [Rhodospirillaceae bacterium]|nr:hypothetical protein [Rhodospirillaceae bacterium]
MDIASTGFARVLVVGGGVALLVLSSFTSSAAQNDANSSRETARNFCIAGTIWTTLSNVPPAVAREYDAGENFARANQALFSREDLENTVLVNARAAASVSDADGQDSDRSIIIAPPPNGSPSPPPSLQWLFVPRYDAFLAERTNEECTNSPTELFFANIASQQVSGAEQPEPPEMLFTVESGSFVRELGYGSYTSASPEPE